ncbi:MAG: UDP-N-acetylmuramoyl-L-alanine--D-glutamate ligase [Candidatus Liptonbacteria bacterium]
MKVAILGFGREGLATYLFLKKQPAWRDAEFWILDGNPEIKMPRGIKGNLGKNYLKGLEKFDYIFRSPGIPYLKKELQAAKKSGVKISSATVLFFEEAEKKGVHIIGVTGSKGKTTTCHLLYQILRRAGRRAFLAGNVGVASLDILSKLKRNDWVVLELSSFQLQDLRCSPPHAVVLDVFPEHLDAHSNLKEYYAAKANLVRHQKKDGLVVYMDGNSATKKIAGESRGKLVGLTGRVLGRVRKILSLPGGHVLRNAAAAATLAREIGIPWAKIVPAIANFKGVEHRLEFIRSIKIGEKKVDFYNDSAGTNPDTTIAAIASFPKTELILLAGGHDKGLSYKTWPKHLAETRISRVILCGANLAKIYHALGQVKRKTILAPNITTAVTLAFGLARMSKQKRVAILLSPGAASFDQFRNYAERGKVFKFLVNKLRA